MDSSVFLAVGIALAAVALCALAAFSIAAFRGPGLRSFASNRGAGAPATIVCPRDNSATRVEIGLEPGSVLPAVLWCERFPEGPIACDRSCLPMPLSA